MAWLWSILFIILVSAIVFISITLAYLIDYFEKYSRFSAAFLSGIVFSIINSFPEFITSMMSCYNIGAEWTTIFNNLVGGNLFILCSLGFVTAIFIKNFNKNKIQIIDIVNIISLILCYVCLGYGFFVPDHYQVFISANRGFFVANPGESINGAFRLSSLFIMMIYAFMFIFTTFFQKKADTTQKEISLPRWLKKIDMKAATFTFFSLAFALIGISVGISFVDEQLIEIIFGNNQGFGAALLLGIPTSLPELVSIILLCKIKNYNAAFQSIFGSVLFSLFCFSFCDMLCCCSPSQYDIYDMDVGLKVVQRDSFWSILISLIMIVMFAILFGFCYLKKYKRIFVCSCSILITLSYVAYVILGLYVAMNPFEPANVICNDVCNLLHQTHQNNSFFFRLTSWNPSFHKI